MSEPYITELIASDPQAQILKFSQEERHKSLAAS